MDRAADQADPAGKSSVAGPLPPAGQAPPAASDAPPPHPPAAGTAGGPNALARAGEDGGPAGQDAPGAGRRLLLHAALLAGYVAGGVAMTWPRATYLAGYVPASRDSASYVWGFWWVAHQAVRLGNPWTTTYLAAPFGVRLGFHTLMPLPGVLMAPATLAAGPAFAYNLLVVLVPGLLGYAACRAARLWLRSWAGAIAAGAFYGCSAMLTEQSWYHLNIAAGAVFLPMALEASVRLRRAPSRRRAAALGVVMGAAVLTDQESAVLAAIVVALALGPWLARGSSRRRASLVGGAVAVAALVASPQIIAMIEEIAAPGGLAIPSNLLAVSYTHYGIGLPGMFSPTPRVGEFGLGVLAAPFLHGRDNENMPMFGTVLTALALAGLAASRRRRGAWALAGLWTGCALLALGPSLWIGRHEYLPLASWWHGVQVSDLMPYTWFIRIPGLASFREADRLAILGLLPAALLAGAAVDWLRFHARPAIVAVAALGLLEAGYSGSPTVSRIPAARPALDARIAAGHSRSVVLDLPFGLRGGIPVDGLPFFPQALLMATEDGRPRSIAYVARLPWQTKDLIDSHPFYADVITVQHEVPPACPWAAPGQAGTSPQGCSAPAGVLTRDAVKLTSAQLTAARGDAARMRVNWVIVWKRNPSVQDFVLPYLRDTGFRFAYRVGHILVYRRRR